MHRRSVAVVLVLCLFASANLTAATASSTSPTSALTQLRQDLLASEAARLIRINSSSGFSSVGGWALVSPEAPNAELLRYEGIEDGTLVGVSRPDPKDHLAGTSVVNFDAAAAKRLVMTEDGGSSIEGGGSSLTEPLLVDDSSQFESSGGFAVLDDGSGSPEVIAYEGALDGSLVGVQGVSETEDGATVEPLPDPTTIVIVDQANGAVTINPPPIDVPAPEPTSVSVNPEPVGGDDLTPLVPTPDDVVVDPSPIDETELDKVVEDPPPVVVDPPPAGGQDVSDEVDVSFPDEITADPSPVGGQDIEVVAPPVVVPPLDPDPILDTLDTDPVEVSVPDLDPVEVKLPPVDVAGPDPDPVEVWLPPIEVAAPPLPPIYLHPQPIELDAVDLPPLYVDPAPIHLEAPPLGPVVSDPPPVGGVSLPAPNPPAICPPLPDVLAMLEDLIPDVDPATAIAVVEQRLAELFEEHDPGSVFQELDVLLARVQLILDSIDAGSTLEDAEAKLQAAMDLIGGVNIEPLLQEAQELVTKVEGIIAGVDPGPTVDRVLDTIDGVDPGPTLQRVTDLLEGVDPGPVMQTVEETAAELLEDGGTLSNLLQILGDTVEDPGVDPGDVVLPPAVQKQVNMLMDRIGGLAIASSPSEELLLNLGLLGQSTSAAPVICYDPESPGTIYIPRTDPEPIVFSVPGDAEIHDDPDPVGTDPGPIAGVVYEPDPVEVMLPNPSPVAVAAPPLEIDPSAAPGVAVTAPPVSYDPTPLQVVVDPPEPGVVITPVPATTVTAPPVCYDTNPGDPGDFNTCTVPETDLEPVTVDLPPPCYDHNPGDPGSFNTCTVPAVDESPQTVDAPAPCSLVEECTVPGTDPSPVTAELEHPCSAEIAEAEEGGPCTIPEQDVAPTTVVINPCDPDGGTTELQSPCGTTDLAPVTIQPQEPDAGIPENLGVASHVVFDQFYAEVDVLDAAVAGFTVVDGHENPVAFQPWTASIEGANGPLTYGGILDVTGHGELAYVATLPGKDVISVSVGNASDEARRIIGDGLTEDYVTPEETCDGCEGLTEEEDAALLTDAAADLLVEAGELAYIKDCPDPESGRSFDCYEDTNGFSGRGGVPGSFETDAYVDMWGCDYDDRDFKCRNYKMKCGSASGCITNPGWAHRWVGDGIQQSEIYYGAIKNCANVEPHKSACGTEKGNVDAGIYRLFRAKAGEWYRAIVETKMAWETGTAAKIRLTLAARNNNNQLKPECNDVLTSGSDKVHLGMVFQMPTNTNLIALEFRAHIDDANLPGMSGYTSSIRSNLYAMSFRQVGTPNFENRTEDKDTPGCYPDGKL